MNKATNKFHCDLKHPTRKEMDMQQSNEKAEIKTHEYRGWQIINAKGISSITEAGVGGDDDPFMSEPSGHKFAVIPPDEYKWIETMADLSMAMRFIDLELDGFTRVESEDNYGNRIAEWYIDGYWSSTFSIRKEVEGSSVVNPRGIVVSMSSGGEEDGYDALARLKNLANAVADGVKFAEECDTCRGEGGWTWEDDTFEVGEPCEDCNGKGKRK